MSHNVCHTVRHNVTDTWTRRVTDDRSHASPDQTRPDQIVLTSFCGLSMVKSQDQVKSLTGEIWTWR